MGVSEEFFYVAEQILDALRVFGVVRLWSGRQIVRVYQLTATIYFFAHRWHASHTNSARLVQFHLGGGDLSTERHA